MDIARHGKLKKEDGAVFYGGRVVGASYVLLLYDTHERWLNDGVGQRYSLDDRCV